jgi:hypothetical protein
MVVVAANGVCAGLFFPRFFAALTSDTPVSLRVRVMTVVTVGISAAGPLGFLGAGFLTQASHSAVPGLVLAASSATAGAVVTIIGLATERNDSGSEAPPVVSYHASQ